MLYSTNDLRVAIGAINDTVIRDKAIEFGFLNDKSIEDLLIGYQGLMNGIDDKRSTKDYRETVALNLIRDYLKEIMNEL